MTDPKTDAALRRLAERGTPRGADRVLEDAAGDAADARPFDDPLGIRPGKRPVSPARYAIAAAVIALVAAGGLVFTLQDDETITVASGPSNFCDTMAASPLEQRRESIVYVDPEATAGVIEEVGEVLEALPEVESVRYVDRDETFQNFSELFRDDPAMLENVRPEQLPTSYEVKLVDRRAETRSALREAMLRRPGVYDVQPDFGSPRLVDTLAMGAAGSVIRSGLVDGVLLLVDDLGDGAAPDDVLRDVDTLVEVLLDEVELQDREQRVVALRARERLVDYVEEACDLELEDLQGVRDLSNGIVPSDAPRLDEGE